MILLAPALGSDFGISLHLTDWNPQLSTAFVNLRLAVGSFCLALVD